MAKEFDLLLTTPNKICINKKVIQATFYTNNGYTTILSNHAKIIGYLSPGIITIKYLSGEKQEFIQNYGLFNFENNKLCILSDYIDFLNNSNNLTELNNIQKIINTHIDDELCTNKLKTILNSSTKEIIKCLKNKNNVQ